MLSSNSFNEREFSKVIILYYTIIKLLLFTKDILTCHNRKSSSKLPTYWQPDSIYLPYFQGPGLMQHHSVIVYWDTWIEWWIECCQHYYSHRCCYEDSTCEKRPIYVLTGCQKYLQPTWTIRTKKGHMSFNM